jgi:trk system potassium uptake protein
VVSRRLGLTSKLVAQAETRTLAFGDVRRVLLRIGLLAVVMEVGVTLLLTGRFLVAYDRPFGSALWEGLFHAVSAFNNAGFALWSDSLSRFATDPWVCLPVMIAVVTGGLGFPVVFELTRHWHRPGTWTLHTRITVYGTALLLLIGTATVLAFEWRNPATLGPLDWPGKLLTSAFQGVTPRTAGFNTVDYAGMHHETWLVTVWLMFVGGGPAGTAGGIKVTTFFLLGFVIWAEIRGNRDVVVFHRRLAESSQRQALTIALLALGFVATATLILLTTTDHALGRVLFEAASAFGTVGLSTGITGDLPGLGQVVLMVLMFVGRVGPITAASALALRERPTLYRLPEERPVIA